MMLNADLTREFQAEQGQLNRDHQILMSGYRTGASRHDPSNISQPRETPPPYSQWESQRDTTSHTGTKLLSDKFHISDDLLRTDAMKQSPARQSTNTSEIPIKNPPGMTDLTPDNNNIHLQQHAMLSTAQRWNSHKDLPMMGGSTAENAMSAAQTASAAKGLGAAAKAGAKAQPLLAIAEKAIEYNAQGKDLANQEISPLQPPIS